jgi:hypothetical protein
MLAMVGDIPTTDGAPTFDDFWLLYPRRVAKKDARNVWLRMNEGDRAKAIVGLCDWRRVWEFDAARRGEEQFNYLPYPATWLNGERWEDELPAGHKRPSVRPASPVATEQRVDPMPDHVKTLLAKLRKQ